MRGKLLVLLLGLIGLLGFGLTTTIPVGVTAQEVQEALGNDAGIDSASLDAAVKRLQDEQRRRITFFFVAYMVIWAVWGGYALYLGRKQAQLSDELRRLRT